MNKWEDDLRDIVRDDQTDASIKGMGAIVWNLYSAYCGAGFTDDQAFELVKVHLTGLVMKPDLSYLFGKRNG